VSLLSQGAEVSTQLIVFIISALNQCFTYDEMKFISKDRFDSIHKALIEQLDAKVAQPKALSTIHASLIPCLAQLASTVSYDHTLWKSLNHLVLMKTRHSKPAVRLGALKTIEAFYAKMGEDFLELLPQTVPFLAELLEGCSLPPSTSVFLPYPNCDMYVSTWWMIK
jgi:U3 small nucleolar RNA-associated protein 10